VGALVQANHGDRERLTVDGVHVGEEIPTDQLPSAWDQEEEIGTSAEGSIIVIVATDAPLMPHQLRRLAQRVALGIARVGGGGGDSSGDIFLAFSTANAGKIRTSKAPAGPGPVGIEMLPNSAITPVFWGVIEATEEAILNALVAADTMVGRDGITAHALPRDRLLEIMTRHGRGPGH
jgi:D-aminopeptidase